MVATNGKQRRNKGWGNLRPCKPGETHNPNGRPKGSISIWSRVKRRLRQTVETEGPHQGKRYAQAIADALVEDALNGRQYAVKELLDRADGAVPTTDNTPIVTVNVTQMSEDDLVRIATSGGNGTAQKGKGSPVADRLRKRD